MTERTVISGDDIRAALAEVGVPPGGVFCFDSTYVMLSETDIMEKLRDAFTAFLIRENVRYQEDAFDCENFAASLWGWTTLWHSKQRDRGDKHGVALGPMCNSEMKHGFTFAIHESDAGVLYPCAYEPQLGPDGFSCGQIAMGNLWQRSFLAIC